MAEWVASYIPHLAVVLGHALRGLGSGTGAAMTSSFLRGRGVRRVRGAAHPRHALQVQRVLRLRPVRPLRVLGKHSQPPHAGALLRGRRRSAPTRCASFSACASSSVVAVSTDTDTPNTVLPYRRLCDVRQRIHEGDEPPVVPLRKTCKLLRVKGLTESSWRCRALRRRSSTAAASRIVTRSRRTRRTWTRSRPSTATTTTGS